MPREQVANLGYICAWISALIEPNFINHPFTENVIAAAKIRPLHLFE